MEIHVDTSLASTPKIISQGESSYTTINSEQRMSEIFQGTGVPQGDGPATHTGLSLERLLSRFSEAPAPTAEAALFSAVNREPGLVCKEHTLPNCASGLLQEHVEWKEAEYLVRQIQARRNKSPGEGSRQETGNSFLHL